MMIAIVRELLRTFAGMVLAVVLATLMVGLGAGFGVDERQLDARMSSETQTAIREQARGTATAAAAFRFIRGALGGELGVSSVLGEPVELLVRDRAPVTLPRIAVSWAAVVFSAVVLALMHSGPQARGRAAIAGTTAILMTLPAGLIALASVWLRIPLTPVLTLVVFPHIYRLALGLFAGRFHSEAVLAARARGIGGIRLAIRHVAWPCAPELFGLGALALNLVIGAAIPLEAITGTPGLGHLVWQAALGRDVAVIGSLTLMVSAAALGASSAANLAATAVRMRSST